MSDFGRFASSPLPGEEVVISGISGKFPNSESVHEFRDHLFKKEDMVQDIKLRWKFDHKDLPRRSGIVKVIDKFDAGFFGVHPRQAHTMDPMMRMIIESALEAVFDAGISPSELEGTRTGVYIGACWADAEFITLTNIREPQKMGMTGALRSLLARRIAYILKLQGPSFIADTACSSSLNALETAYKDIRTGKCDSALVGGCCLILLPGSTLQFMKLGLLSKDGKCKVFDEEADGYVRSEAISCIFLQRAKDSRRIYAQIVHAKANCDGHKESGITFPSTEMQSTLMREVYEESGINPNDLAYLEGHCTGTRVGDPQEIEAIDSVIGKKRDKVLLIGSIKSNVGHSEPASGLCSIAKVLIAMEHSQVPANLHLNNIKKGLIGFEEGRLKPVVETTPFEGDQVLMGINNFGFGGNNCHVIMKRLNKKQDLSQTDVELPRLLCVSGRTEEAVFNIFEDVANREFNVEYIALLQEIFKYDIKMHNYRGYAIVSKNKPIRSSVSLYNFKTKPLHFYFGKFEKCYKIIGESFLQFPVFKEFLTRFNETLNYKNLDIFDIVTMSERDPLRDVLGAVAVQIGIGYMMKMLSLEPLENDGDSWGKLAASYFQGILNIEQIIHVIMEIGSDLTAESKLKLLYKQLGVCDSASKIDQNSVILNVSNSILGEGEYIYGDGQVEKFLDIIGRLYESGYNPQVQKLFPEVTFPVSRGTPMISPLIKWNHSKSWFTYDVDSTANKSIDKTITAEAHFSPFSYEHNSLQGHVVDGRNLFPATGYLFMVWRVLANQINLIPNDTPIMFEDVRFVKAVTYPKADLLGFLISIQPSGWFEITQGGGIVVKGRAKLVDANVEFSSFPVKEFDDGGSDLVMEADDVYKELHLRGYNYKGMFKGVVKANLDATSGLIKWEDDWVAFVDNMLQLKILQYDSRNLYVPVGMKRCTINPTKQPKHEPQIPITIYKDANIIKCDSVEIVGMDARSIARKKIINEPLLEKYVFVPNSTFVPFEESLRINTQLILEISLESTIRSLELLNDQVEDVDPLLLKINSILEGVPLINPDFTISTKRKPDEFDDLPETVKIESVFVAPENNYILIAGSRILEEPLICSQIVKCLKLNSFLLTRENRDFEPRDVEGAKILTVHTTENDKMVLLRKSEDVDDSIVIEISSSCFDWVPQLQNALKDDSQSKVIIYSQNKSDDGTLGLINCILREKGGERIRGFFIIDEAPKFDVYDDFYKNQLNKNFTINVYKNGEWGTYRHLLLGELEEVHGEHCFIDNSVFGDLSSLKWVQGNLNSNAKNIDKEGFIKVHYAALNFKDIMIASGRITADVFFPERLEQQKLLGFEFSGVNLNGKRVMGLVKRQGLSTVVTAISKFILEIPDDWSLEEAATTPVVYATVVYGLIMRAQMKPGMSILIHSGTGGIGLAAINVCSHYKCEIFVTVGTQEKRDYLRKHFPHIPDDHIGNSRDTTFEEMVKAQTNGRGVDIVLNSLAEEKLLATARCLTKNGSFVEIGKFDLAQNNPLSLLLMEKGASFHGVMLDLIFRQGDSKNLYLMDEVHKGIKLGFVKPLPRKIFQKDEVEKAFRYMAVGKHIGKVLVQIRDNDEAEKLNLVKAIPKVVCDHEEKSYIIIGGLGGFGLELADWLILRGAKKLILSSRQGVRNGYQRKRINIWESYGVSVLISTSDVTTKTGCEQLIDDANRIGPVDAIFNLGVVLKDAAFENQTEEDFHISFGPKAFATKFLDEITREKCKDLRYFVVFSSISCGRGNAGQSNYGMANSVMERICENRRRDGLPGIAIEWGAIGDVGLVAQLAKNNVELEIRGTLQQRITNCLDILDRLITQKESAVVASMVVAQKRKRFGSGTAVEAVLSILGIKDITTVSRNATLVELGLDSITATEIIQVLETDFDIYLTAKDIRTLTIEKLMEAEKSKNKDSEQKAAEYSKAVVSVLPEVEPSTVPIVKMISKIENEEESAPIAFILTGFEGYLSMMEPLCSNLNCNSFGLKYTYLDSDLSIEEIAKCYLPSIEERLLRNKPFNLICHSFGALLGMEIAHLLESKGYNGNLFSIDGGLDYFHATMTEKVESSEHLETQLIVHLLSQFMSLEVLLAHKEKLLDCKTFELRMDYAATVVPAHMRKSEDIARQGLVIAYKRLLCGHNYKFSHDKLKCDVYLYKASKPIPVEIEKDYGWSKYCQGSIAIDTVEGNHTTILDNPKLQMKINETF